MKKTTIASFGMGQRKSYDSSTFYERQPHQQVGFMPMGDDVVLDPFMGFRHDGGGRSPQSAAPCWL